VELVVVNCFKSSSQRLIDVEVASEPSDASRAGAPSWLAVSKWRRHSASAVGIKKRAAQNWFCQAGAVVPNEFFVQPSGRHIDLAERKGAFSAVIRFGRSTATGGVAPRPCSAGCAGT
jgi:hypothetical protein